MTTGGSVILNSQHPSTGIIRISKKETAAVLLFGKVPNKKVILSIKFDDADKSNEKEFVPEKMKLVLLGNTKQFSIQRKEVLKGNFRIKVIKGTILEMRLFQLFKCIDDFFVDYNTEDLPKINFTIGNPELLLYSVKQLNVFKYHLSVQGKFGMVEEYEIRRNSDEGKLVVSLYKKIKRICKEKSTKQRKLKAGLSATRKLLLLDFPPIYPEFDRE